MKGLVPRAHSLLIEFRFVSEFLEEAPVVNGSFNTSIWRIPKSKVPGYSQRLVEDRKPRKLRILTGPSYNHAKTSQNKFAIVAPSHTHFLLSPSTSHITMNPFILRYQPPFRTVRARMAVALVVFIPLYTIYFLKA